MRFQPPPRAPQRPIGDGRTAAGLLIGLLIGAGAALWFAPREGVELRRTARRRLRRLGWRAEDAWLDLRAELRRAGRRVRRAGRVAQDEADLLLDDD